MLRTSSTVVVERGEPLVGSWATEPYEVGWAGEALVFIRLLDPPPSSLTARVQLSPDGQVWADEGTSFTPFADQELHHVRVREFGAWLRVVGEAPESGVRALVVLSLKS